jgi:hypothetical protein
MSKTLKQILFLILLLPSFTFAESKGAKNCKDAFDSYCHSAPGPIRNRCDLNSLNLLKYFYESVPGFDIEKARVLIMYRHRELPLEQDHWLLFRRKSGTRPMRFSWHAVLEYDGYVFDRSSPPDQGVQIVFRYFYHRLLFRNEIVDSETTPAELYRLNSIRIQDVSTLLDRIRVRVFNGQDYFDTWEKLSDDERQPFVKDSKVPNLNLGEYLQRLRDQLPIPVVALDVSDAHTPHELSVQK